MQPVFQKPMDGQCVRASICSLFEIPIEAGPRVQCDGHTYDAVNARFICVIPEHRSGGTDEHPYFNCDSAWQQTEWINDWAARFGLKYVERRVSTWGGKFEAAPPVGFCVASGPSPRFPGNHAVVWDTRMSDFEHPMGRMVHDPAPVPEGTRPGIKSVESFSYFEVVDPSLLHKLAELRVGS